MRDFVFDLRYAARILRQNPGFAAVAIVTLALGIGGATAIFSVLDPVLIRPLAYREPERLVSIATYFPSIKLETLVSADYADFERYSHAFEGMAAYQHGLDIENLIAPSGPLRAKVKRVTPSFFRTLGVDPALGRGFVVNESQPVAAEVAILTFGLWTRAFAGDAGVVGRTFTLDQQPYTVIGVMPSWFRFPEEEKIDLLTPLPLRDASLQHGPEMMTWRSIARLKPGVSLESARAELEPIFARIRAQYKWFYRSDVQLRVVPLHAHQVRAVRLSLLVLAGAVGFLLLIACVNVAHILLARAAGRAREIAVRAAVGAGRMRLARQLLTESALLGLAGGAAGWLLAYAGLGAAVHILPADIPHIDQVAVDLRALGFAALAAVAAGLLFGLAPAFSAWRMDLIEALKLGGGASGSRSRRSIRDGLLAAEIAFSMVLLTVAALLMESLWHLENVPLGFRPEHVLSVPIPTQGNTREDGQRQKRYRRDALERIAHMPGVAAAALADSLPPADYGAIQTFSREDRPLPEPGHRGDNMLLRAVSADYFPVMGIPLVKGRLFTASETRESKIVLVNEALVRRFFPNENPLGKLIGGLPPDVEWKTIVGVVGDERNNDLRSDPQPEAYSPIERNHWVEDAWLVVRTPAEPANIAGAIRRELSTLDRSRPIIVQAMPERIAELLARPRFQTLMMSIFSALALVMAAVGVYGVASWAVVQRRPEIGVRLALGATARDVLGLVLARALRAVCLGIAAGAAGALAAGRYLESMLFGVKPNDALTLLAAASVLAVAAVFATSIPALRAARANPAATLRSE
jgi:putative ABC transport system permease protein